MGVSATKTSVYIIHQKQALITVTGQNSDLRVTLFIPGFFGWCSTGGGGVFYLHPLTPLSLKSDISNFVKNYFGIRSIFCGKKNRYQIDNRLMSLSCHLCSHEYRKLIKTAYFKITAASLSFFESY